ncbi:MAG: hypothetical protein RMJ87_06840 [Cytophagales bacterium]|nr:hypothetical protein [Bernardetiaceae bacterium]MDW8204729.1 hypothetical protein [Cytophagales bacterium]
MMRFVKMMMAALLPWAVAAQNLPAVKWKTTTIQLPAPVAYPLDDVFDEFSSVVEKNPVCVAVPQKDNSLLIAWQSYWVTKPTPKQPNKTAMSVSWQSEQNIPQVHISRIAANGQFIKDIKKFPRARLAGFCQSSAGAAIGLAYGDTLMVVGFDKQWKQLFEQLVIGHVHPYTQKGAKFTPMDWGSARLVASADKYIFIFAHQQEWSDNEQKRDVHQGDMLVQMNLDGSNFRVIWNWGVSHSLDQRLLVHDGHIVTAALGDGYPEGISLHRVTEQKAKYGDTTKTEFNHFPYWSPTGNCVHPMASNQKGITYGTLGSLSLKNNQYYISFSQRGKTGVYYPGLLIISGKTMRHPWKLLPVIEERDTNKNPLIIRSAWIGDYLFMIWKKEPTAKTPRWGDRNQQRCEWVLLNARGEVVRKPESLATDFMESEDLFTYANGDIGWVYPAKNAKGEYRSLRLVRVGM